MMTLERIKSAAETIHSANQMSITKGILSVIAAEAQIEAEAELAKQNESVALADGHIKRLQERVERCRDYAMRIEENEITAADILEVLGYSRNGMIDLEAKQALQHKEGSQCPGSSGS